MSFFSNLNLTFSFNLALFNTKELYFLNFFLKIIFPLPISIIKLLNISITFMGIFEDKL